MTKDKTSTSAKTTTPTTNTRTRADYSSKLRKLEEEKQQLIRIRKEEIFSIIDKTGCLAIDNELLSGAFVLLKEIEARGSQKTQGSQEAQDVSDNLKQFEALIRGKAPVFFRRKSRSSAAKAESDAS